MDGDKVECKICGEEFEQISSTHLKYKHNMTFGEYRAKYPDACIGSSPFRKGNIPWNKGLTKKTDERVAKYSHSIAETVRKLYKNGRVSPFKGKTHSLAARKKISKINKGRRIIFTEEHLKNLGIANRKHTQDPERNQKIGIAMRKENNPERCRKISEAKKGMKPTYPKPYYVPELGHGVRSTYEEKIGLILKKAGVSYDYEGKVYEFDGTSYRPDFPITDRLIVEAKGYFPRWQQEKYKKFKKAYPDVTLAIVGGQDDVDYAPICNIHIPWSDREKLVEGILREP